MNKELIKTYFKEFEHWINGGKVLSKYTLLPEWSDCQNEDIWRIPDENISKVLIVINDEFVEFRKALAEGKIVQYNFGNYGINRKDFPNTWKDLNLSIGILADRACPENYRIKLDEPKFQIGDWITDGIEVWQHKENCKVKDQSSWSLWKPKTGEWCWVYDDITKVPVLRKFVCFDNDFNAPLKHIVENHDGSSTLPYKHIEPFIGVLPLKIENTKKD